MNEKWRDMETVDSSEDSEELLKEDCFFLRYKQVRIETPELLIDY